jgi:hypothetical protein
MALFTKNNRTPIRTPTRNESLRYIGKLLEQNKENREWSMTPPRPYNNLQTTLDDETIVLHLNVHGGLLNSCIDFKSRIYKHLKLHRFQKVYMGGYACRNIDYVNSEVAKEIFKNFQEFKDKNGFPQLDFLDFCRKNYKNKRMTVKQRLSSIRGNIKKRQNIKNLLYTKDSHKSYIYMAENDVKQTIILDKMFETKMSEITEINRLIGKLNFSKLELQQLIDVFNIKLDEHTKKIDRLKFTIDDKNKLLAILKKKLGKLEYDLENDEELMYNTNKSNKLTNDIEKFKERIKKYEKDNEEAVKEISELTKI